MLEPVVNELADELMQVVLKYKSKITRYQAMEAIGFICQAMVGGYIKPERHKEYAEYSIEMYQYLLGVLDDFNKERPDMPIGVSLFVLGHLYYFLAKGLQDLQKGEITHDSKSSAPESQSPSGSKTK